MRAPSREDLRAAGIAAVAVLVLAALVAVALIERNFEPRGGFGRPQRIPACGRSYRGGEATFTLAQIRAAINPGGSPVIFEPVVGELPLTAPFEDHRVRLASGETVCDTVVYLHVGPDAYAGYDLEGGP